jgi:hypothetical protein
MRIAMRVALVAASCGSIGAAGSGCAAGGAAGRDSGIAGDAGVAAPDARRRAAGLELTRWFVPIEPKDRDEAITAAVDRGLMSAVAATLSRDGADAVVAGGFLMFRVEESRLEELKGALGGSPQVRSVRLGALPEWADLESVRIEAGRTIFFAGRPRIPGESLLRLWLRGWCFPTVDGARARVELRLTTEDRRQDRIALDPTLAARPRLREVEGGRTILELAPGEALVLLEKPVVPPEGAETDPLAALPPPTIAALLLAERAIPGRATVLVVTASFADMLPTPADATSASVSAGAPLEVSAGGPTDVPVGDPAGD